MKATRVFLLLPLAATMTGTVLAAQQTTPLPSTSPVPATASAAQQGQNDHYRSLANDYGTLNRYAAANASLPAPGPTEKRVLFFGDSITDGWHLDQFFPGRNYVNRGISGQTTPQMLVRFRQDVIDLHPAVLVVLAGTNDLAGLTGPETTQQIENNYASMAELAKLHGIQVVFSSVMPVNNFVHLETTTQRPPSQILALNTWLQQYCAANNLVYLDYFSAMVDPAGMLKREISGDGLHPNAAGYAVMAPLAQAAIDKALAAPAPLPSAGPTAAPATPPGPPAL